MTVLAAPHHPGRFVAGARLWTDEAPPRRLVVEAVRPHPRGGLIVRFGGVEDRDAAEELRGSRLAIDRQERRPLEEGEFWPEDLQGLEVRAPSGESLGQVAGVVLGEAQDRLVLELAGGNTAEVPFVEELVVEVRPQDGYLVVSPVEGLLTPPA
ncbi:MAG: ribosome maturation factor RimM [Actinomycetota bacterium]|nr:ribosome maturation factor RimM [Actinomycetota bacterium]